MRRRSIFNHKWLLFLTAIVATCTVMASASALAADPGAANDTFKVLDRIDAAYKPMQATWYGIIRTYAERLFWLLVLVDFGWSSVIYVLDKQDITELVKSLVKKIFPIGFFWGLLKASDTWIPAIINSFSEIGKKAGNVANSVTPDGIAGTGYELAKGVFVAIRNLGVVEATVVIFPLTIIAIIIFLAFLFVAAQLLVTLIETYIAVGGGVILLGFGGSRFTTDFATKYLQYAVGTGLKLMILYMVIGMGQTLFDVINIQQSYLLESSLAAMGVALVYGYIAIKIPAIASAMMSGSPSMTAGDMMTSAIAMGAAVAGVGAMASGGLKQAAGATGSAAAGVGGLAQALGAGYSSALDSGKSGMSALAHAGGEVAKHGLGLGAGSIGDAVKGGADSFSEKVANSTGGQIASSIEATRGGSMSGAAPTSSPAAQGSAPAAASGSGLSSSASSPASAPASASTAPGSSSTSPAASAPAAATASSAPTGGGSAPVSTPAGSANASSTGDASSASIGPGSSVPPPTDTGNLGQQKAPLHDRIRDLQGFVPQDMAPAASINIQAGHTAD